MGDSPSPKRSMSSLQPLRNPFRDVLSESPPPFRFKVTLPFRPKPLPSICNGTTVVGNGTQGLGARSASSQADRAHLAFREWAEKKERRPGGGGGEASQRSLSPRQQYEELKSVHRQALDDFDETRRQKRLQAAEEKKLIAQQLLDRNANEAAELHSAILFEQQKALARRETMLVLRLQELHGQKARDSELAHQYRRELEEAKEARLHAAAQVREALLAEQAIHMDLLQEASVKRRRAIEQDKKALKSKLDKRARESTAERKVLAEFVKQTKREVENGLLQSRAHMEEIVAERARQVKQESEKLKSTLPSSSHRHETATKSGNSPSSPVPVEAEERKMERLRARRIAQFASRNSLEVMVLQKQQSADLLREERRRAASSASVRITVN